MDMAFADTAGQDANSNTGKPAYREQIFGDTSKMKTSSTGATAEAGKLGPTNQPQNEKQDIERGLHALAPLAYQPPSTFLQQNLPTPIT